MASMPNVLGEEYVLALNNLQTAGVVNPSSIGYFGTYPVTIDWIKSTKTPGSVTAQSPVSGTTVAVNSAVILTVSQFPVGIVFP